ncbi:MAG: nickel pincer cofactor biosynthesis protein LarC [Dehalococcoidia bacterium]|nr:nickel pincer cofactor biosynthesis protein LarC [Dehalococcoidia bacterium]
MGKTAYFDLYAGCSGDMMLGALLDAGLPRPDLEKELRKLPLEGYRITAEKVKRGALRATWARVILDEGVKQPDRFYNDIVDIIAGSRLGDDLKKKALDIFRNLGEVESKIHGTKLELVHFHEIGAVDSIVDIVGTVIGFDLLGVDRFYASPFPMAEGSIECRHGALPLPAPATVELISRRQAPVVKPYHAAMQGRELVTPTGAAIVITLADFHRPGLNLEKVGYGAGSMNADEYPNVMRLWIGKSSDHDVHEDMVLLETNIDDMNPQIYDYVMERLFAQGALDVWFTHIQMKKNRPAVMLSVLSPVAAESKMAETIMRETSTLGIRVRPVSRHIAGRDIVEFESSFGKVSVKVKRFDDEVVSIAPEYDECKKIAASTGVPLRNVYRTVEAEARKYIK